MDVTANVVAGLKHRFRWVFAMAAALAVHAAYSTPSFAAASAAQLLDSSDGTNWLAYGRTYGEQHYSPLAQINARNVFRLGLAWSFDLGPENSATQPVEADGILYFVVGFSLIRAVDAVSGKLLWVYDAKAAAAAGKNLRLGYGSRGIAWWDGKIYAGTQDGRLIALDAKTGEPVWTVQTFDPREPRYITGAPRVFDGKVAIGNAGDAGAARGFISAYDAQSGRPLWRFYTVPGKPADGFENDAMAEAAKTWSGDWWRFGGNGTVWNAIAYDPESDTLYFDTGNAYPYNAEVRTKDRGDNLYTCSLLAVDAKTGAYKWHYQFVPRDMWDYDSAMDIEFADISIKGRLHRALMVAPKNGFFYVFDRKDGKLISAEPFVKVTWASRIDMRTGRPVEYPAARAPNGGKAEVWPSGYGAHNWLPMAYSPKTKLAYIPAVEMGMMIGASGADSENWLPPTDHTSDNTVSMDLGSVPIGTGKLLAWNPATQKPAWSIPQPAFTAGGVLATQGGLVFNGSVDGAFSAYEDTTGKRLWSFKQDTPVIAPPISFSVNGKQYLTVLSGLTTGFSIFGPSMAKLHIDPRSQTRRVLTFALDGKGVLPAAQAAIPFATDPAFKTDSIRAQAGFAVYAKHCLFCHGMSAVAAGSAPDLRRSPIIASDDAFTGIVHGCALVSEGMPCFDEFTSAEIEDLRHYLRSETWAAKSRDRETNTAPK